MNDKHPASAMGIKNRFLWTLLFLVIAAGSIWAVTTQSRSFSLREFGEYLSRNDLGWLLAAAGSMLAYICFGAAAILCLLRGFGYRRSPLQGLSYTAADLYFSAITPSATGGQPASAYFMIRDGVPVTVSTLVLLANLMCYTVSILLLGLLGLILRPGTFARFGTLSKVLIVVGAAIQVVLAILFEMLLWKKELMRRLCDWVLRVLTKLRLLRNPERKRERLSAAMDRYGLEAEQLKGRLKLLGKALAINLLHRMSQLMVTVFCFLAQGGRPQDALTVFSMQSNVALGATVMPIPGSMGVTDYLMLDGFSSLMNADAAANLELLSRATSFYICIFLCGVAVLIKSGLIRLRREKV